jgi:tRNA (adenine22-N1)-methyltransferase
MGGELMVELMEASPRVVEELDRLVLQPMSGVEELRRWLYENEFHVREDRLVPVGSRWYQVLSVKKAGEADPWPEGFPRDCYMVGYRTFRERDRLLAPYCREQLQKRREQLCRAAGTAGEDRLAREVGQLEGIIREAEAWS